MDTFSELFSLKYTGRHAHFPLNPFIFFSNFDHWRSMATPLIPY